MPLSTDDGWDTRLMFGGFILFYNCNAHFLATAYQERHRPDSWVFIFLNTHSWYFKSVRDPMNSDSYLPCERAVREGLKAMGSHFHVQSIKGRSLQIVNMGRYWNGTHIRVLSTRTSDRSHMSPETHTARHTQAYLDACVRFGEFVIHGK